MELRYDCSRPTLRADVGKAWGRLTAPLDRGPELALAGSSDYVEPGSFMSRERDPARVFDRIYWENRWGSPESRSGQGSELNYTVGIRARLPGLLRELGIRTVLDAPCGDFNWMAAVDLGGTAYHGIDVVPSLIEDNRRRYAGAQRSFSVADLTRDSLPQGDLVLCRHLLIHLTFAQGQAILANFQRAGSKYLLITSNPQLAENSEIVHTGGFRPLNMERPPFSLPPALQVISDAQSADDPTVLALYPLDALV